VEIASRGQEEEGDEQRRRTNRVLRGEADQTHVSSSRGEAGDGGEVRGEGRRRRRGTPLREAMRIVGSAQVEIRPLLLHGERENITEARSHRRRGAEMAMAIAMARKKKMKKMKKP
jgi:hypothetical protein